MFYVKNPARGHKVENTIRKDDVSPYKTRKRQYVCMVITYSRVWINRVRLPILLVVSSTVKMNIPLSPCVPENLVSRDGFSRPVTRKENLGKATPPMKENRKKIKEDTDSC